MFCFPSPLNTSPFLFQLNPQHCIPTLVDDDVVLWESRAILSYLANKYGRTDSLYPKDPVKRAKVDQRLFFDMGTLYLRFQEYYYVQVFQGQAADPEKLKKLEEAMEFFDTFLEGQKYAAGDNLTIADLSLIASVSTFEVAGFPIEKWANVKRWYATCKATAPGWEENRVGAEEFRPFFDKLKN